MAELPGIGNAVQSSEVMRNLLGLNYKSAALNLPRSEIAGPRARARDKISWQSPILPVSYAGVSHTKAVFSELIKSSSDERINAGLAAAGVRLGRWSTLDRHVKSVAKLSRKGLSERRIAAELYARPLSFFLCNTATLLPCNPAAAS